MSLADDGALQDGTESAAPQIETDPQADPLAPPAVDGGFRPLHSIDVLPIDRLLPTIARRIRLEPLSIIQAATGSGKSSRIPATIIREWYAEQNMKERQEQRKLYAAAINAKRGVDCISESSYPAVLRKHPFVLVTQPRRIAAISLAKRVASELGEEVGQTVGFKIGHESMADTNTRLVFVTSGWLLQKLVHTPGYLAECSHLVLDEIHERGLDADILYVILKRVLRALITFDNSEERPFVHASYPSLVLMSATFNTDLFGAYFAPLWKDIPAFRHYASARNLQPITIDTRRYPVSIFHLEDVMRAPVIANNIGMLNQLLGDNPSATIHALVSKMSKPSPPGGGSVALGPVSNSLLHLISWLCAALALCHRSDPEEGSCVLVFFPGLQEIEAAAQIIDESLLRATYQKKVRIIGRDAQGRNVEEEVYDDYEDGDQASTSQWRREAVAASSKKMDGDIEVRTESMSSLCELMILHSVVEDQLKVFEPIPPSTTRIILATNIAESSVTIPYVKYVIDLGAHKEVEYNHKFQCEMLVKKFVSQASAKQRAGRCGRLSPGTVLRLYPTAVYERQMTPYDLPELLRVSLASTILRLKMTVDSGNDEHATRSSKAGKASAVGPPKFDPSLCNLNDPHSVLSECMQPPELSSIDTAYEELLKNGAVQLTEGVEAHKELSRFQTSVPGAAADSKLNKNARVVDHFDANLSIAEKRAIYQASVMTPLGRFFAALPFSFHLSRLVALGVCFGPRFLVHSVVISSALSQADVYLMPMQSRGAQGEGRPDRKDDDPFPQYVFRTTAMRMWCDAGINSDAIAIIRLMDAYLKYRQHISEQGVAGVGGLGKRSRLLDDWCAERGVHMKRIKTLASSIAEISLRLSSLVHQEEERDALLQLAALCGKSKSRAPTQQPHNMRGSVPFNSRFVASSSAPPSTGGRSKHYTYANSRAAVADRDSDRGNSAHDDLFHLLRNIDGTMAMSAGGVQQPYNFRSDILSTNVIPDNLLSLDPETVAVLQFMLASSLLPNLLMGSVNASDLGRGLPYGQDAALNPANTFIIDKVPLVLLNREEKLQHRAEFKEVNPAFTHVLVAAHGTSGKKGKKSQDSAVAMGSMALEFSETDPERGYERLRVALDGRPANHLYGTVSDRTMVPVLTMPTLEMLVLSRMFNSNKFTIFDRSSAFGVSGVAQSQFHSQAYQREQQQTQPAIHVLAEPKLPGKAVKWRLFSPRSPARLDFLSPISALTAYQLPARVLQLDNHGFSDYDAFGVEDLLADRGSQNISTVQSGMTTTVSVQSRGAGKSSKSGKDGKGGVKQSKAEQRADQMASAKLAAASQVKSNAEMQVWAVAASMTVSASAQAEIRAEKVSLLPVGANAGVTSAILSLLLPGNLILTPQGISGIKHDGVSLHYTGVLPAALQPALLRMREMMASLLSEEFVVSDTRFLAPLFLQLFRPLIKSSVKSYPSTDPAGVVRRPRLNLLPPSQPRVTTPAPTSATSIDAGSNNWRMQSTLSSASSIARRLVTSNSNVSNAAVRSVSQAAEAYEQQRAAVLERKRVREAVASGATIERPASATVVAAKAHTPIAARTAPMQQLIVGSGSLQVAHKKVDAPKHLQKEVSIDPNFVPDDDPTPQQNGKPRGARRGNAATLNAPAAASPSPPSSPAALLAALTSTFFSSPSPSLNLNELCVRLLSTQKATWKDLAGPKLSLKDFIGRHKEQFLLEIDAINNETIVTHKQHKNVAAAATVATHSIVEQHAQKVGKGNSNK